MRVAREPTSTALSPPCRLGSSASEIGGRGNDLIRRGRPMMRSSVRSVFLYAGLITLVFLSEGCGRDRDETAATQQAREALGVKETGKERTVESKRSVIVEDTKKVID